jgi:hypothetical protein
LFIVEQKLLSRNTAKIVTSPRDFEGRAVAHWMLEKAGYLDYPVGGSNLLRGQENRPRKLALSAENRP